MLRVAHCNADWATQFTQLKQTVVLATPVIKWRNKYFSNCQ